MSCSKGAGRGCTQPVSHSPRAAPAPSPSACQDGGHWEGMQIPGQVEDVPADGRGVELDGASSSFPAKPFCDSMSAPPAFLWVCGHLQSNGSSWQGAPRQKQGQLHVGRAPSSPLSHSPAEGGPQHHLVCAWHIALLSTARLLQRAR